MCIGCRIPACNATVRTPRPGVYSMLGSPWSQAKYFFVPEDQNDAYKRRWRAAKQPAGTPCAKGVTMPQENAARFGKAGRELHDLAMTVAEIHRGRSDEDNFDHPTQKPVEPMRSPNLSHLRRGELVYDPFVGSDTTLAAAREFPSSPRGCSSAPQRETTWPGTRGLHRYGLFRPSSTAFTNGPSFMNSSNSDGLRKCPSAPS